MPGAGRGAGGSAFHGDRASVWDDERAQEADSGDGRTTVNAPNVTELCGEWNILCYICFTEKKKRKKKIGTLNGDPGRGLGYNWEEGCPLRVIPEHDSYTLLTGLKTPLHNIIAW